MLRWIRFNAVGLAGAGVQLSAITLLSSIPGIQYLAATFLAVEAAILHNFLWHEHWTWRDRIQASTGNRITRFFCFHLANGTVSLIGNLVIIRVLAGSFRLPLILASFISILACSVLNFFLGDRFVFRNKLRAMSHE